MTKNNKKGGGIFSWMKALLVYPKYPETFWSYRHALSFISRKATFPPLGLLTIAAMMPEEWEKRLVDANVSELKDSDIDWADMVFISAMIVQKDSAQEIISRCKARGRKVVAGGPTFTTMHEQFRGVDHFVLNEAESTLPLFLKDLEEGSLKQIYTSAERPDITRTPVPLWSLIRFKDYASMVVQYSRGCPFDCEFCDIVIMNGKVPRTKSNEQMMNEFNSLYKAGWRGSVFIVDDNFIGNKASVKRLLPALVEWQMERNHPFKFLTEASTNLADDEELMMMMSDANFSKVFLGIETPNVDSLKECGKIQNVNRDLSDTIRKIQAHGMQVMGGFIVGFDNDSEQIFETQARFIQETGVVTAMVGILGALPKTRLWYRLKAEGRLTGDSSGENTDAKINFIPRMNRDKLIDGYKKLISTIYSRKYYYQRINTFIRNYKPSVRSRFSRTDLEAFLKSVWRIGILSGERLHYWKLLAKTFFTKKKAFPVAVELSIHGQHFKRIAKRVYS